MRLLRNRSPLPLPDRERRATGASPSARMHSTAPLARVDSCPRASAYSSLVLVLDVVLELKLPSNEQ